MSLRNILLTATLAFTPAACSEHTPNSDPYAHSPITQADQIHLSTGQSHPAQAAEDASSFYTKYCTIIITGKNQNGEREERNHVIYAPDFLNTANEHLLIDAQQTLNIRGIDPELAEDAIRRIAQFRTNLAKAFPDASGQLKQAQYTYDFAQNPMGNVTTFDGHVHDIAFSGGEKRLDRDGLTFRAVSSEDANTGAKQQERTYFIPGSRFTQYDDEALLNECLATLNIHDLPDALRQSALADLNASRERLGIIFQSHWAALKAHASPSSHIFFPDNPEPAPGP
jgi:hypothetical protein